MAPNPREVATLANEIMQTEDRLASLRQQWESLFSVPQAEPKPIGRPPRENSAASQVLAIINGDPTLHWDAEQLAHHLKLERETVAAALYNLHAAKKIARHSRGNYEAISENPYAEQIDTQLETERLEEQIA